MPKSWHQKLEVKSDDQEKYMRRSSTWQHNTVVGYPESKKQILSIRFKVYFSFRIQFHGDLAEPSFRFMDDDAG